MTKRQRREKVGSKSHSKRRSKQRQNIPWLWVGLGVVIVVIAGYIALGPKNSNPVEISISQAYEKYQQGAFFLDVRPQEEWDRYHIPDSTLIPLEELQGRLSKIPQDRDVVVICRSGVRSKEGWRILSQAGFNQITCLKGGVEAWRVAGYPLVSGP